ncbi:MAG TPA: ACP S-malonyltransferase [Dehalococcoidales bacterium]|nr:ACP S-malonyltransferase [Dehalococcoidales bacterium]
MPDTTKAAYVFPGQGAQSVGMGHDLYDSFATAKAIFKQADEVLGFPLSKLCFEGPDEDLRLTINTQPAILTVSYICYRLAQEAAGGRLPSPAYVAGHSLGEYTALAAAGVLDFPAAVFLSRERGRLMYEAGLREPGGMVAILGLDEKALLEVCDKSNTQIANFNCPGQLIISGSMVNLPKAAEYAQAKGASRVVPLQVSGAFHSPLMQPAKEGLFEIIAKTSFRNPRVPIIANITGKPLTTAEEVKTELIEQLCNCVQWQRSIEYMISNGVSVFYEMGPGKVLSGLIKRINKEVEIRNIGDAEAIKSLAK